MSSARIIEALGRTPVVGRILRAIAHRFAEGSIVTIRHGEAAGYRWKRHHRYVNGYWIGQYELDIQAALKRELKHGDTFFDVGANAGFFTLVAARLVGPTGKCVAFDPLPINQESIGEQIHLNGLTHCHGVAAAVGDAPGEAVFTFSSGDSARGQLGLDAPGADQRLTVRLTTLDDAVQQFGVPSFIKLDIEGAEDKALIGARNLLSTAKPGWLIEIHTDACELAVRTTLKAAGYAFFSVDGTAIPHDTILPHHVIARHPSL